MITDFEDFCTWAYMIVDDLWSQIAPQFRRPGPAPTTCSDSELITMVLVGECRGWVKSARPGTIAAPKNIEPTRYMKTVNKSCDSVIHNHFIWIPPIGFL